MGLIVIAIREKSGQICARLHEKIHTKKQKQKKEWEEKKTKIGAEKKKEKGRKEKEEGYILHV